MDTNKILSADLLDLIFDERNKDYGAYELRKTYHRRITKALIFTGAFVGLAFTGAVLANKIKPGPGRERISVVTISAIPEEEKKIEIPKPPVTPPPVEQVRTEKLTNIKIDDDDKVPDPPPTQDDLASAKIDVFSQKGIDDDKIATPEDLNKGTGILETKVEKDPEIFTKVEVEAKFTGNWERFLLRNLNAQVPVDNGAAPGRYMVMVQFVVDLDGSVSDVRPLTSHGFGMEEEAIRVIKKATKWEPAIQNGNHVKAYRKQPITFEVTESN